MTKNKKDDIVLINEYLSKLDGISEYIIVLEGFPVYWGKNIDQGRAEELAALAIDLINSISTLPHSRDEYFIISTETRKGYISVIQTRDLIILAQGRPEIVRKALYNIYMFREKGLKCPWCGNDISLHVIKCPSGKHSLPMGVIVCPFCHRRIEYIKCPHCSKPISPNGYRIVFKRPKHLVLTGSILGFTAVLMFTIGYILSNISLIGSYVSIASAGLLAGLTYSAFKQKIPAEVKEQNQ